jgi:hypothetical protein
VLVLIAAAVGLTAIVFALYSLVVSWILLALSGTYLLTVYWILKRKKLRAAVPGLSAQANELLLRFPHFYSNPSAHKPIGGAAGALALAGVIVAIVGCFRDFWWGGIIGLIYLGVMANLAKAFEPTRFLRDEAEKRAHIEIVDYFASKRWL